MDFLARSGLLAFALVGALAISVSAKVVTAPVYYPTDAGPLEGYVACGDATPDKRPAVIVVHDWNGLDDYEKMRARGLAELGYLGFAADVYGKGVHPTTPEECREEADKLYKNPELLLGRLNAAVDQVRKDSRVDPARVAVIGYCFGGKAALDLTRSGADVSAVVSFHGGLQPYKPAQSGVVKAAILVLHGTDDPVVPPEQVAEFHKEMLGAKLGYEFIAYQGAVHAFTVPGKSYNLHADKDSWEQMKRFLKDVFGEK